MLDPERVPLRGGDVAMPIIGLGTYALSGEDGVRAIRVALDAGYRHIDTATMYRNEADIGRALAESDVAREEVFVTTKLPPEGTADPRRVPRRACARCAPIMWTSGSSTTGRPPTRPTR